MVGLEIVLLRPPRLAHQLAAAQDSESREGAFGEPRRLFGDRQLDRLAGHGHRFVQPARRLPQQAGKPLGRHRHPLAAERPDQLPRLGVGEARQLQLADVEAAPAQRLAVLRERPQEGRRHLVLAAVAADEQKWRRIGRLEDLVEQQEAVDVAPLQVVDHQQQRPPRSQPRQQLAQRGEGAPAQHLEIFGIAAALLRLGDRGDPQKHRKKPRQSGDPGRQQHLRLVPRQAVEITAEGVDQAVEGLVGHRLLEEATPPQHHGSRIRLPRLGDEAIHQRRLADPRGAAHVHRHGASAAGREGLAELAEHLGAADERRLGGLGGRHPACLELGHEAEIEQHHAAVVADPDLGGLHVAVHLAVPVQRRQPPRHLQEDAAHLLGLGKQPRRPAAGEEHAGIARVRVGCKIEPGGRQGALALARGTVQGFEQVAATDQLHGEEPQLPFGQQLVEAHQVRMADVGQGAEALLEAVERLGASGAQHLERHQALLPPVERLVDHPEGAGAEPPLDEEPRGAGEVVGALLHGIGGWIEIADRGLPGSVARRLSVHCLTSGISCQAPSAAGAAAAAPGAQKPPPWSSRKQRPSVQRRDA